MPRSTSTLFIQSVYREVIGTRILVRDRGEAEIQGNANVGDSRGAYKRNPEAVSLGCVLK